MRTPTPWVEVVVGTTSLGRSKVGAVPYAVEADHASTASAASGALGDQLKAVQSEVHTPSAFHAWTDIPASIAPNTGTSVLFEQVEFDLGSEYSPASGVFTAKEGGVYLLSCGLEFRTPTLSEWSVGIYKNKGSVELTATDLFVNGTTVRLEANTMAQLVAGDSVDCRAFHTSPLAAPLWTNSLRRNSFSATRIY